MLNKYLKINDTVEFKKIQFKVAKISAIHASCLLSLINHHTDTPTIADYYMFDDYYIVPTAYLNFVFQPRDMVRFLSDKQPAPKTYKIISEVKHDSQNKDEPFYIIESIENKWSSFSCYANKLIKESSQVEKTVQEFFAHWKKHVVPNR